MRNTTGLAEKPFTRSMCDDDKNSMAKVYQAGYRRRGWRLGVGNRLINDRPGDQAVVHVIGDDTSDEYSEDRYGGELAYLLHSTFLS